MHAFVCSIRYPVNVFSHFSAFNLWLRQVIIRITFTQSFTEVSSMSFSLTFWIVTLVLLLFLTGILTAAYNDDKTKGL